MADILLDYYLWLKALHVITMIAWMAGMLYLPRLYVYHTEQGLHSDMAPVFQTMERRLLRYIMNPAMVATFVVGVLLIYANPGVMEGGWMHAKLTLVLVMAGLHGLIARYRRQLLNGTCTKTPRFFRIFNEIPTVLMIVIIILVVVQPF